MPFSSTSITSEAYTPNGITTNFPFFFLALSADEIQVVLTDADGVETLLTSGYDIQGIGDEAGGTVVFSIPPNYTNQSLIIRAVPSFAQELDFENQGPYNPEEINKGFDRAAQRSIYLRDLLASGVALPGGIATVTWASVQGKPSEFTPAAHVHAAADITSGVLADARIPSLAASKINSGTFDAARIPGIDASKIITGTIDQSRLPVTSGGVVSSGGIADLTAPQQALIVEGTLVTTTDGSQWRYSGTGSKVLEASYVELSTATDWAALTSVPPEITSFAALSGVANKLGYFSGTDTLSLTDLTAEGRAIIGLASQAALQARASVLTTKGDLSTWTNQPARVGVGSDGQVLTADASQTTGLRWATPAGSSGGIQTMPNFVTVFSGNGDGATSNDAAFTAAEASAYERIWLPEGIYYTTKVANQLTKTYTGPGEVKLASGASIIPNLRSQTTLVTRTLSSGGVFSEYGESSGLMTMAQPVYNYIRPGTREFIRATLADPDNFYFHAAGTAYFERFYNISGSSGTNAHLAATASIGATTATLNSPDHGLVIGDRIGFMTDDNATPTDVVTLTNVVGAAITFTPALANTYTFSGTDYVPTYLSGYASSPQVSKGRRTNNSWLLMTVSALAPGDTYGLCIRTDVSYTPKAGQTHFFDGATVAPFGGDMNFSANGQYGTPWEHGVVDNGFDVAVITVNSYSRTNDTGARGVAWIHDLAKSEGTKPLDAFWVAAGLGRAGLDMTLANLTADGERAIQLKLNQRIYFDARPSSVSVDGGAAIGVKGRGYWGDKLGDTFMTAINDGTDRLDFYAQGTRGFSVRASSISSPLQFNLGNHLNMSAGTQIGIPYNGSLRFGGVNSNTYIIDDGSNFQIVVNGTLRLNYAH